MKKVMFFVLCLFTICKSFANNIDEYNSHLTKAKEYEVQKQWINALGEYWDAIAINSTEDCTEALNSYNLIIETIQNGNPGFGKYDDFEYYDEWMNLLKNFEQYFTQHLAFSFDVLYKRDSLDRENRLATYKISFQISETEKFHDFFECIIKGYNNANSKDWNEYEAHAWPLISAYNFEKNDSNKYFTNNTALTFNSIKNKNDYEYGKYKQPAAFLPLVEIKNKKQGLYYPLRAGSYLPYKLSFSLIDKETDNILYEATSNILYIFLGNRLRDQLLPESKQIKDIYYTYPESGYSGVESGYYLVTVPDTVMKLIESQKADFSISNIDLLYGEFSQQLEYPNKETSYKWTNSFKSLNMTNRIDPYSNFDMWTYIRAQDNNKIIQNAIDDKRSQIQNMCNFLINNLTSSKKKGKSKIFKININQIYRFEIYETYQNIVELLYYDNNTANYIIANMLSEYEGLSPCYYTSENEVLSLVARMTEYNREVNFYSNLSNNSQISEDTSKNGWRYDSKNECFYRED